MTGQEIAEALTKIRQHVHEVASANNNPTTINMARNAMTFLDTSYLWVNLLDTTVAQTQEKVEGAVLTFPQDQK